MYPDAKDEVVQIPLDDIIPNRFQPREVFDERALKELAVSIKEHGVIQPIIVRSVNGKYEIIAGERRYKASALAGLTKIPAIVRDLDDKESSKVALLENLQRKNLNPIEEAKTYQKILELDEMTQEELAKTMGKSQSAVANKVRLLSLPEEVQEALLKEEISERHARALLNLNDPEEQKTMLKKVIDNKMSVRSLEDEIKGKTKQDEPAEDVVASTTAFVNDNPLSPTAELPKDTSNYGKVTIAPPEGEEMDNNKFINYGELSKEDYENEDADTGEIEAVVPEKEEKEDTPTPGISIPGVSEGGQKETSEIVPPAIEIPGDDIEDDEGEKTPETENKSEDIKVDTGSADLDSLLNINIPGDNGENKEYITPAEKIVKTDNLEPENSEDYFKTDDLSNIELPSSVLNPEDNDLLKGARPTSIPNEDNNLVPASEYSNEKYTLDDSKNKIKDLVADLEKHGAKVKTTELNFDTTYQIIIKLDKE